MCTVLSTQRFSAVRGSNFCKLQHPLFTIVCPPSKVIESLLTEPIFNNGCSMTVTSTSKGGGGGAAILPTGSTPSETSASSRQRAPLPSNTRATDQSRLFRHVVFTLASRLNCEGQATGHGELIGECKIFVMGEKKSRIIWRRRISNRKSQGRLI